MLRAIQARLSDAAPVSFYLEGERCEAMPLDLGDRFDFEGSGASIGRRR